MNGDPELECEELFTWFLLARQWHACLLYAKNSELTHASMWMNSSVLHRSITFNKQMKFYKRIKVEHYDIPRSLSSTRNASKVCWLFVRVRSFYQIEFAFTYAKGNENKLRENVVVFHSNAKWDLQLLKSSDCSKQRTMRHAINPERKESFYCEKKLFASPNREIRNRSSEIRYFLLSLHFVLFFVSFCLAASRTIHLQNWVADGKNREMCYFHCRTSQFDLLAHRDKFRERKSDYSLPLRCQTASWLCLMHKMNGKNVKNTKWANWNWVYPCCEML